MRGISLSLAVLATWSSWCAADDNRTELFSKQILPSNFKPPQVFRHVNLVRNINLDKHYPRETINVIIENIGDKPHSEYYLPFESGLISRIGGLEVKDKKAELKIPFKVEVAEYDTESPTEFFRIHLPQPLAPKAQQTLSISYTILSAVDPKPAAIGQLDKQYVQYTFSAYSPSSYVTLKQKTKLKLPNSDVTDYTKFPTPNADGNADPQKQGTTFTYGPYNEIPAGAQESVSIRYEYTKPLTHAKVLERDIEVSHWGGNLAVEERYWLTNRAAKLKDHFSRVSWQMTQYTNPPTTALKDMKMYLKAGSVDPYFVDDIGNVSTSRFRPGYLELKPRYPLFGNWNYNFKVGWNANLKDYLRKAKTGDTYILNVPFLEGPRLQEGIEYKRIEVRVILPEGAKNVKYETSVPLIATEVTTHRTFMDTVGRTALKLSAINLADEWRDRDLIITYDYPWTAGFRKPVAIFAAVLSVFAAAWVIGSLDVSIGKKKTP